LNKFALNRRVLIVGEGRETEYNYFVGFRKEFEAELEATATSVSVARGKGGNARGIVESAIKEAKKFQPTRNRGDRVFLLLDTEGPGRAPELPGADKLAEKNGIEIVYSCPAFEYWLLCHFERISRGYFKDCDTVIAALNKKWNSVCNTQYDKADQDIFDRLSDLLDVARAQALAIDLHYLGSEGAARCVNPSTQVYELIAILIGARTNERCPITGTWKLIGDASVTIQLDKGNIMSTHNNNAANWQL
jgi:hypothetical protein